MSEPSESELLAPVFAAASELKRTLRAAADHDLEIEVVVLADMIEMTVSDNKDDNDNAPRVFDGATKRH